MFTGLLVGAILAAWALVTVPMIVKSQDRVRRTNEGLDSTRVLYQGGSELPERLRPRFTPDDLHVSTSDEDAALEVVEVDPLIVENPRVEVFAHEDTVTMHKVAVEDDSLLDDAPIPNTQHPNTEYPSDVPGAGTVGAAEVVTDADFIDADLIDVELVKSDPTAATGRAAATAAANTPESEIIDAEILVEETPTTWQRDSFGADPAFVVEDDIYVFDGSVTSADDLLIGHSPQLRPMAAAWYREGQEVTVSVDNASIVADAVDAADSVDAVDTVDAVEKVVAEPVANGEDMDAGAEVPAVSESTDSPEFMEVAEGVAGAAAVPSADPTGIFSVAAQAASASSDDAPSDQVDGPPNAEEVAYVASRPGRGLWDPERARRQDELRAQRRRRSLGVLCAAVVVSLVTAGFLGGWFWLMPAVTIALLVTYVEALRRTTAAYQRLRQEQMRHLRRAAQGVRNVRAEELGVPQRLRVPGAVVLEVDDDSPDFAHLDEVVYANKPVAVPPERTGAAAARDVG